MASEKPAEPGNSVGTIDFFPNLKAILAVSDNGVIGVDNRLPWSISEELKLFRRFTFSHTVIMGRKTLGSMGRPLPGRNNWVLSRTTTTATSSDGKDLSPRIFSSETALLAAVGAADADRQFWVIGGAKVYEQLIPRCGEIVCSRIHGNFSGDTFWQMSPAFERGELIHDCAEFITHRWHRIGVATH